jgi:uncharacterized protein YgiM (DUF1202 family)
MTPGDRRRLKLRKGRCSNDSQNCTLAAAKTELPYAGLDSVCPQCGAPLAAIASQKAEPPPPPPPPAYQPAPPVQTVQTPSPAYRQEAPRYPQSAQRSGYDYEPETAPPRDGMMKLTQMVLAGAALALIGFFAWRMFLQPRDVQAPDVSNAAQGQSAAGAQVTQISPPQMRKVNAAAQAHTIPDSTSAIVANLAPGALLDVTGQVQVNGVNWLRVTLPNESSKNGFVREDQLVALGDGGVTVSPMDVPATGVPTNGVAPPVTPATPVVQGPIQPLTPVKYYVATNTANVRQDADPNSARVKALTFNDEVDVVAQRSVGGKLWYQVQLPTGGSGWMNARLLSGDPRESPIDGGQPPNTKLEKVVPRTVPANDGATTETGKRDNQEALSAYGPGATLRVDSTTANLRKEPGSSGSNIVEAMGRDTLMTVEDVRILNGVPWYRVTSPNGVQGWVSGRVVVENR